MKRIALVVFYLALSLNTTAQIRRNQDIDLEQFIEEVFAVQDSDISYGELYEALLLFYTSPINLNRTSQDELRSLLILSESQIISFFEYKKINGTLLSIFELQAIPGFDLVTIQKLLPFVEVRESTLAADTRPFIQRLLNEKNNYLLLRYERTLEEKKGYAPTDIPSQSRYSGSPDKLYARFRISHSKDFSLGFTLEKDQGEELTWNNQKSTYGADFYSFHLQTQNKGRLKNLVLGDYQIQYGQSLLLGAGFSIGKGAETINTVRRSNIGIRPYTSVLETGYFRGAAATVEVNESVDVTTFYSRLAQDAIRRSDSSKNLLDFISSVRTSGLHRTQSEISSKDGIIEQNLGAIITFSNQNDNFTAGVILHGNQFSSPIIKGESLANLYEFSGTTNYNTGLYASYNWQNFSFFGEAARSKSGGLGAVGGLIASLTPTLEASVVGRSYDRDFHSFYGNAFAESASRNQNEKGLYWGMKYRPIKKLNITAYFDHFEFPWLKSAISSPSAGYEYLFRVSYRPTKGSLIYTQFREESKFDNPNSDSNSSPVKTALEGIKRSYLVNFDYPANTYISFKSRVQLSSYKFDGRTSNGLAVIQDINLKYGKLQLSGRFSLFDTDNFENRQYAYEKDLLYVFSIPALSGQGTRQYLLLQYKLNSRLSFWLKYARTHFKDRETIGSGLEEIEGNVRTDLKFQTRVRF